MKQKNSPSQSELDFYLGRHWDGQLRDSKGRFCTQSTYRIENVEEAIKKIRFDYERYKRMYLSVSKEYSRLLHEHEMLKKILKANGLEFCNVAGSDRQ